MILYYLSGIWFFVLSLFMLLLGIFFLFLNLSFFFEWLLFSINSVYVSMLIYLDWISLLFMFLVFLISSMIMFYCCEYMSHDNYNLRFFYLVFFFIMSMILMILSPSMVSIILGWDGLGLVSYCLVIYYNNFYSFNSGMLTILMNRIGDIMIMMSILMIFSKGSWYFLNLNNLNKFILFLVIMACFTKSAQFPFSSWLPAAMAAPTPVSSLVHSSTLVTAGVYLLIRFNYLIYKYENLMFFISVIGMLTMMMAGFSAMYEYDLKKIIAFSTLSQLGLMMVIYGIKFYEVAYFHLLIHAMFKSMMFMASGVFIHSMLNIQDIRFMGNLSKFMPFTILMFLVSNFSLCGFPFMSGFYSKDMILEKIFMSKFNLMMMVFLLISTLLTLIYSFRLMYYLLFNSSNFFPYMKILDNKIMNFSMFLLFINTIFSGSIFNWLIFNFIEEIYLMFLEKILILLLYMLFMYMITYYIYKINYKYSMFTFILGNMWFMNFLNKIINYYVLLFTKNILYKMDKGWKILLVDYFIMNLMDKIYIKNNNFINFLISLFIFFFLSYFFLYLNSLNNKI
uniref:NADH-ubiquinone oxidoreductase chain 5 n=1 Tax=Homalotylus mirabilis TaxID=2364874 RepID=A0A8F7CEW3_9HYME|nr:NADH dehydrogenase subunit 5 [Homalotylus mirabilis]